LRERLHEVRDVTAEDDFAQKFGIEFLGILVKTEEAFLTVRNVQTSIQSSFESTEDSRSSGSSCKSDVEKGQERTRTLIQRLDGVVTAKIVRFGVSLIFGVKSDLLQVSSSQEKSCGIGSSIIGQSDRDSKSRKLMSVSSSHDNISSDLSISDLADHISVGKSDNITIFGRVIFVLVLDN